MTILPSTLYRVLEVEEAAQSFCRNAAEENLHPFCEKDTTAGMEFELQVSVEGKADNVDLPLTIRKSNYFLNIIKRSERGDCPEHVLSDLKGFLEDEMTSVWENSWVRLKTKDLSGYAVHTLEHDLLADKTRPEGPFRSDKQQFFCIHKGKQWLRLPLSYILKLALADCTGREKQLPEQIKARSIMLQDHFLSDNTSPEILSLSISDSHLSSIGASAAKEAARTFFFTQMLVQYANKRFELQENGQRALLYFSPQAPQQQKAINELVPDSFYRQLFMSPCLSGWERGEEKKRYMSLCHRTLSRSQLNTISKLKEAGIITNNLIVLPNTSNTCLANNGTHVTLASKVLSAAASDPTSGFTSQVEKYFGDMVIKILEHFLPLQVATTSAAPYRIDYADFHPEKVLGFLPHELDYTHLRMIWRRWKKKADISFFGNPVTPFGPRKLDRLCSLLMRTKGDYVPDFRLIDYLVALLSTETSPALNGMMGNQQELKDDLAEMGVFDRKMAIYLPVRQRQFETMGFSGFEGRSYSLFPSLLTDIQHCVDLQNLLTALAFHYVLQGRVTHGDIPDNPHCESERRQIFFAAAIGIPTVYVDSNTDNRFLARIVSHIDHRRNSRRYKGYIRIHVKQYQLALIRMLKTDGLELIEDRKLNETLISLENQIINPELSAASRLTKEILQKSGVKRPPLSIPAASFNRASENYYRNELRRRHLQEGLLTLVEDCRNPAIAENHHLRQLCTALGITAPADVFFERHGKELIEETLPAKPLRQMVMLCIAVMLAVEEQK